MPVLKVRQKRRVLVAIVLAKESGLDRVIKIDIKSPRSVQ
jgi:hypothetical protein